MLQKMSKLIPLDKSGVWQTKIFHIYGGFKKKNAYPGDFVKISVKKTKPNNTIQKGFKTNAIIINTKFKTTKLDGTIFYFKYNSNILLKKRLTPRGREIYGVVPYNIKRKKFVTSFPGII